MGTLLSFICHQKKFSTMGSLMWLLLGVFLAHFETSVALLDSDEILKFKPPKDETDSGVEIDELMPFGAGDEVPDPKRMEMETRVDYGKSLEELMPSLEQEARFAPSDESYEHFAKKEANEYTMDDVMDYERRNAIGNDKRWPYGVVPYEVDNEIRGNRAQQGEIYAGMQEWEKTTCVKFKPYSRSLAR